MIRNKTNSITRLITGGALALVLVSAIHAQDKPFTQPGLASPVPPPPPPKPAATGEAKPVTPPPAPEPNPVDKFFNGKIPDAFAKGKFSFNSRLRYEYVDQSTLDETANALTVRTRFGFTTAPLYGFQGMIEGENVTDLIPDHNYNAAGANGVTDRPAIADPETTELNQAWLGYTYTNWISAKGGRQRIALDNHRFVGDVGWRQNMQTFDSVTVESKPINGLSLFYAYVWEVNRVFGDVEGLATASPNRDFRSDSHFINVSYQPFKYGRFVGYSYLLDLENRAGFANSCATYGIYFAGSAPVSEKISLGYRAEYAHQTDYKESPQDYAVDYYNLELSATMKPVSIGGGYEVLGSDENEAGVGNVGFRTPLATLHAFNGWADVFLATPANGLRDAYAFGQVTLPGEVPLRLVYHKYDSDEENQDLGQEINLQASKKFGKYWTVLAKYAYYDGKEAPARYDAHKIWAQVEFNF
jgi:hypothetical protein